LSYTRSDENPSKDALNPGGIVPAKLLWLRDAEIPVRSDDPPNNDSCGLRRCAEWTPCLRRCLIRLRLCNSLRVANQASFVVLRPWGLAPIRLAT